MSSEWTSGTNRLIKLSILACALLLVTSCGQEIPQEKAKAIFQEMAAELIVKQGDTVPDTNTVIESVLAKNGYVAKDLNRLFKDTPEAASWLEEALKAEADKRLSEAKAVIQGSLDKNKDKLAKKIADLDASHKERLNRLDERTIERLAEIDKQNEDLIKKLQEQIKEMSAPQK